MQAESSDFSSSAHGSTYNVSIFSHPSCLGHDTGVGHPESPARYTTITSALALEGRKINFGARRASEEDLRLCHSKDYLNLLRDEIKKAKGVETLSTGDAQISAGSWDAATHAVGAALSAVDTVLAEKKQRAFVACRPPGHHASSDRGMGFCLVNNAAVAARYAQTLHGIERVAIIDWDVHHGNGTQDIFDHDPSVLYLSTHRAHFYPHGTGYAEECGVGNIYNFPISETPKESILKIFHEQVPKILQKFDPGLVIISAGFDAHELDPLGGFDLDDAAFVDLTHSVCNAGDYPVVSVLEGGYSLEALASVVPKHVTAMEQGL